MLCSISSSSNLFFSLKIGLSSTLPRLWDVLVQNEALTLLNLFFDSENTSWYTLLCHGWPLTEPRCLSHIATYFGHHVLVTTYHPVGQITFPTTGDETPWLNHCHPHRTLVSSSPRHGGYTSTTSLADSIPTLGTIFFQSSNAHNFFVLTHFL